jgi:hypothetical protein
MHYRWLLPLANLVIDTVLFGAMVWVMSAYLATLRHPSPLWHQTTGTHYDPALLAEAPFPQPISAIVVGTLPASVIVALILPNGWRGSSPFDLWWAVLHSGIAVALWYCIGRTIENGHPRLQKAAIAFALLRCATIPVSLSMWSSALGGLRDLIFTGAWIGAAVFALGRVFMIVMHRVEELRAPRTT